MLKKEIRQTILRQLKAQDKERKAEIDKSLLEQVLTSPEYREAQTLATYLAFDFEYNTQALINQTKKDGKVVLVPKTYPKSRMIFTEYIPDELEMTKFGIWEPKSDQAFNKDKIDLIHVPGLAFNNEGFRIGFGAGFYDRYLEDFQGETTSTIYPCQEIDFQADSHDIPVRKVFTYAQRF